MRRRFAGRSKCARCRRHFLASTATREKVEYDSHEVFLGSNLQEELGRVVTTAGVTVRQQLTPLTSVTFEGSDEQDRFEFSPLRNSDSRAISASVAFDPLALIKGRARVGYRDFKPVESGLPRYEGVTASVDLLYVLLNMTKFTVQAMRDVQYSYDVNQPYYLQTGVSGSITQQVFGPLDVVGRAGIQHLDYRDRAGRNRSREPRRRGAHLWRWDRVSRRARPADRRQHRLRGADVADRRFGNIMVWCSARRSRTASDAGLHSVNLRIAFDLDGVLADMEAELMRQAKLLFGESVDGTCPERRGGRRGAAEPADEPTENTPAVLKLRMTARQQRRLWKHVESIEDFWETLDEIEPGADRAHRGASQPNDGGK